MGALLSLYGGIMVALEPVNLGLAIIGVIVGLFVGAMPGLGSANGVAILLPFMFGIQGYTGGATSSITLGIPGLSTAVATTFDGRPMALAGKAYVALVTAAFASFIGGTFSNIMFTAFALVLASMALSFGDPEVFALMLLAFATFVGLGDDDILKTIFSICVGLVLATVGFDITGFSHGIRILVLTIGVYGIGEMLWTINTSWYGSTMTKVDASIFSAIKEFRYAWRGTMIGSAMGFFVGILPATGATPGSLMAYGMTKLTAKDPSKFGKGGIDGIAAPESANNSASTGAMLPMMTLGIPG
ncbi:MAG: putative tricarboxylic transport membrane protein [Paracoccaceae bacterium]|jgi:putative tricarboxylic transport membrane protein